MVQQPAAALLVLLSQAGVSWGATEPPPTPTGPTVERKSEASPEDLAGFRDALERYEARMEEFKQDTRSYADAKEKQVTSQVSSSYSRTVLGLEEEEASLRALTKQRFEAFLANDHYKDAEYTAHVMFRLSELYFEESEALFQTQLKEYDASGSTAEPPLKDFTRSLDLYRQIEARFPRYERMDGVLYMTGHIYWDKNSRQADESKGREAFLRLVDHTITLKQVANKKRYGITYQVQTAGSSERKTGTVEFTSSANATASEVLAGLAAAWNANKQAKQVGYAASTGLTLAITSSVRGEDLRLTLSDPDMVLAYSPSREFGSDANLRMGDYYFENYETERSIPYYERIVQVGEEGKNYDKALYKLAWAHYQLANMQRQDEYDKALEYFKQLLDYSQRMLLATGVESRVKKEGVQYMAISFADMGNARLESPHLIAERYFKQIGERPYEAEVMKHLAKVLVDQASYEEAIEAYRYLQRRWPLDPDNPKYQIRVAQLYMNLPVQDPESSAKAQLELAELYKDPSPWWEANRTTNPDAIGEAKKYIEQSLAQVAIDYHLKAQASEKAEEYSIAADKYREYLRKFPFADDYYTMQWYLADALLKANRLEEAEKEYAQLLKTASHEYQDGALYKLMQVRRQKLINLYGKVEARPQNAILEKETKTRFGGTIAVYLIDDEHKAFIETSDNLMKADIQDPQFREPRNRDMAAMLYLTGQIYYEYGHLDEARKRLLEVVEKYPKKDEGAYAAALVVRSYQDENDLESVRLYTNKYSRLSLGESKEAMVRMEEFRDLEEGAAFTLAYNLIQEGKREEAARAFQKFLQEYPKSVQAKDALFNAANSLEIIGKTDEANVLFEDYINKYPKDERSRGLYFRIASNYASILELDRAITYYKRLVQNFPDAPDSPNALFNAAFLEIGAGFYKSAAEDFEAYATRYPSQPDAEFAFYKAGDQWEQVGQDEALAFYRRYLKRFPGVHADHSLEAQYRIIKILEKQGRPTDKDWKALLDQYNGFAQKGAEIGVMSKRYAAEGEFRAVQAAFDAFQTYKYTNNEEADARLALETKPMQLKALEDQCLALIAKYGDFVYSSAAIYVQANARFVYADMLFTLPAPKGFTDEMVDEFKAQMEQVRLPVEDKAKNMAVLNLEEAKKRKAWCEWQNKTMALLYDRFPTDYPRERAEMSYTTGSSVAPVIGPVTIDIPKASQDGAPGGAP